jgi:hypothetical protein
LKLDYDGLHMLPGNGSTWYEDEPPPLADLSAVVRGIVAARLRRAGYELTHWTLARSTNGYHGRAWLTPEPGTPMETVALQAVAGSDPLREACNVQRVRSLDAADEFWRDRWNVLYDVNPHRRKACPAPEK